jgi:CubicO group peptidase (beta-lactamase class C family)
VTTAADLRSERLARELSLLARRSQSERRLPSVSAAVARAGDVIWSEALGVADVDAGIETTPNTQYAVGSITKTFTAAAIMALRDAGALALDDPLGEHLPGVPLASPSLRRLLSHAAGIQREIPGSTWETLTFPGADELLAGLTEAEEILEPGRHWHYSNLAFALLGQVVSRAAGMPYERFVEERFLDPLELRRTTWRAEMPAAHGYFVEPYADRARPEPNLDLGGAAAVGQLWSTATDLCRWGSFLASPDASILQPETAEEMATVQVMLDNDRWTDAWGLGVSLTRAGDRVYAGHGGGMPGFLSGFVYVRKEEIAAAALANATADMHGLAVELAGKVADAFPLEPEAWRPEADATPPEIAGILGRWWSEGQETILSFHGGRLEARRADDPREKEPSVFAQEEDDVFRVVSGRERGEVLRVVRDENGEAVRLYWATYPFFRTPRTFSEHAD